ncbi:MAG: hypothetical protein AB2A00_39785 [Myxococcota bacterium]
MLLLPLMMTVTLYAAPVEVAAPTPAETAVTILAKTGGAKKRKSGGGGGVDAPLKGDTAWVVPGLIGSLVPLVLLLLPFMWTPGFGFWAMPFLVVAVIWGAVACGLGGLLTWLLCTLLTDTRSGFLWPTLAAAGVGAAGVAATAVITALVMAPFFFFGLFWYGWAWDPWYFWYEKHPLGWGGRVFGFVIWTLGLAGTSIASTLVAAWLYQYLGIPKTSNKFEMDVVTPQ